MIKNLPSVIDFYKCKLEKIADLEEIGEDVTKEEQQMFEAMNDFIQCADEYLNTQNLKDRKSSTSHCSKYDN